MCGCTLALALCAGGVAAKSGPRFRPIAEPGEVVAAELNFDRAARDKGRWTGAAESAAPGAVMFVPQPVKAREWLKGRANPAQAPSRQPTHIWSSCDGTLALSQGVWQGADGKGGSFATLWQRQKDGAYKWVLDQRDVLASIPPQPDMVGADVADCPPRAPEMAEKPPAAPTVKPAELKVEDLLRGEAQDGTLRWDTASGATGRELHVFMKQNGAMREVLSAKIPDLAP